jgi:LytS/YehU family sensor histidine kinase
MTLAILVLPLYAVELNGRVQRAHREAERRSARHAEERIADAARHGRETVESGKALAQAELKMLQAQIEPHFLFNTLASAQHLVDGDPALAKYLLLQLNDYLRAAIPVARDAHSTLAREFDLVESLLNIVRVRMGGRLTTSIELPDALRERAFPPLVLLTLVENAVEHGVEPKLGPVHITVTARETPGDSRTLEVSVSDDGVGLRGVSKPGGGIGLANIRERLAALYDGRAHLRIRAVLPAGVLVTVSLPLD